MTPKDAKGLCGKPERTVATPARLDVRQVVQALWFETGRDGATMVVRRQGRVKRTPIDWYFDDDDDDQIVVEHTIM
jgi:hypothetical protein